MCTQPKLGLRVNSGLVGWLVGGLSFRSLQHLRSYQDGYQFVIVHTHGKFKVLPQLALVSFFWFVRFGLLELYILATFKVISRQAPLCDSMDSW